MTYVIAEPCIDVLDISCVSVCPVDCIHFEEGTDRKLFIDPNECFDCGACEPECPVNAIFPEESLPAFESSSRPGSASTSAGPCPPHRRRGSSSVVISPVIGRREWSFPSVSLSHRHTTERAAVVRFWSAPGLGAAGRGEEQGK